MALSKKHKIVRRKVYLTFPGPKTQEAIICDMYEKYRVRFNIRSASVDDHVGLIALELTGTEEKLEKAFEFFRERGVKVEPIEINVIE
ncbi:MAG: NIL domain-containing protein [Deltaproteobacteria bacterium]|nr:NIL domain-containing protein [Deltaproteobacteria bacterium]